MVTVFNNPEVAVQSWYVIALSREVRPGQVVSREFLDRSVAVYRTASGRAFALEGRCAHLGADLGQGTVVGEALRCAFHHWTYAEDGRCVRIPYMERIPGFAKTFAYPTMEKYGAVWIFNGPKPSFPIPNFPGSDDGELLSFPLRPQMLNCHPHVVTCNGLDIQHFKTVHGLAFAKEPTVDALDAFRIQIKFEIQLSGDNVFDKSLRLLAGETLSTSFTTWGGNMATITGQAGLVPLLVLFTHRPLSGGRSASQTFFFVPRQHGLSRLFRLDAILVSLSKLIMAYILLGDRKIFETIRFQPHLVEADRPLATFIQQVNNMATFDPSSCSELCEASTGKEPPKAGSMIEEGAAWKISGTSY